MNKALIGTAIAAAIVGACAPAVAQYGQRGSPGIEDFFRQFGTNRESSPMNCNVSRSFDRAGNINYLRMECRSYRRN